ncbi:MAG: prepilin peptidase [Candidatus Saccharimonadales bacterium]
MIVAALVVLGLCWGSFVNALVWRVHEQSLETTKKRPNKKRLRELSIVQGRSMCPDCKHELGPQDLIPVLSWLSLGGKCRYCRKPISWQYPLVELLTAGLFVASYMWWPSSLTGWAWLPFGLWLMLLVGLVALTVYDLRWMLLPNRIVYPLSAVALTLACVQALQAAHHWQAVLNTAIAVAIGGGIFYVLFQVSAGKWIGGGDVRLGWLLGLVMATPSRSFLFLFLAAIAGSVVSVPLLLIKKAKKDTVIPFGPFLIAGAIVTQLFGASIISWYEHIFLGL